MTSSWHQNQHTGSSSLKKRHAVYFLSSKSDEHLICCLYLQYTTKMNRYHKIYENTHNLSSPAITTDRPTVATICKQRSHCVWAQPIRYGVAQWKNVWHFIYLVSRHISRWSFSLIPLWDCFVKLCMLLTYSGFLPIGCGFVLHTSTFVKHTFRKSELGTM